MNVFNELFDKQIKNQKKLLDKGSYGEIVEELPVDNTKLFSYHIQQLMSEIGEVLESDKRWKNIRNNKYDRAHKLDELADCFIVWMNLCIFSGYTSDEILNQINAKLEIFNQRIDKEDSNENSNM